MNSKIYSLSFIFMSIVSITFAQNTSKRDTVITDIDDKYKVVTNRFFDNWFIGGGGGAQFIFGDHDKQMQFKDRLTPAINFYLGKWFSPGLGFRGGYTGYKLKGLTHPWDPFATHSTGEKYQDVKNVADLNILEVQKFKYNHLHGDVLFNLSNIFSGYKGERFLNTSFFAGFGWGWVNEEPAESEPSINLGFYNTFRLSNALNLTLDLRGSLFKDDFDGEPGARKEDGVVAATMGLAYNIGKRVWDKERIVEILTYDEAELNMLRDRVNKLANDNEALNKQLADANSKDITDVKIEKNILVAPILVTFPINKSIISNEARVNLGFFAKAIKEGKTNVVYNISGYADKGTGTPATNERLSRERAEAIYNLLIREFGVSPLQLTISYYGGVDNMYYNDPRLSRAVILLGK